MKKFVARVSCFLVPLLLILIPPFLTLVTSAENFGSIDGLIKKNPKYLIGYEYNECNYRYLKSQTLNVHPKYEVITLGSSRVLQFRSQMFDVPFYNAGYTIESIGDFIPFLESIPENKYPKYLIMGLDQWMFNKNWDNFQNPKTKEYWSAAFNKNPDSQIYISVMKDLLNGKYLPVVFNRNKEIEEIGFNAIVNNTGFRNDGSILYGKQIQMLLHHDPASSDYHYSDTYDRIDKGNRRLEYGQTVNPNALVHLNELLDFCSRHQITVIGFIPPFADAVAQKMNVLGKYRYMRQIYPSIKPYFKKFGFELYNFPDMKSCKSNDGETIDGLHGGEVAYLRILMEMLRDSSDLNKTSDIRRLEADLNARKNNYEVYPLSNKNNGE